MRFNLLTNRRIALFLILMIMSVFLLAEDNLVQVEQLYPGKVDVGNFTIDKESKINIFGKGAKLKKRSRNILCYGWIINAKTGKVEWTSLKILKNKFKNDTGIFSFEDNIVLNKGIYKVFYTAVYDNDGIVIKDFGDLVKTIFTNWDDDDIFTFNEHELQMIVKGQKNYFHKIDDFCYYLPENQKEIVAFSRIGEDAFLEKSFQLKRDTKVFVKSTGEKQDRAFYDYGRIYDMKNHTVVWPSKSTIFEYAGGGWKNVQAEEDIILPAGNYSVSFVSDGTHSFNDWNVMPPNNPEAWGIQISCLKEDYKNIDFSIKKIKPIVDMMKVGNYAILSKGLEITKDIDVRVICLGEYSNGSLCDYGWIENAVTNEVVWKFRRGNTVHAGGNKKNRIFNDIISLDKGKYFVKYVSDDSHSYMDWNSTQPDEKEYWGISIWTVNDLDKKFVRQIDEQQLENENIIVKIDKVGDHQKLHKDFIIKKDGNYRIYAIGEGDDDEMFDTGWIKRLADNQVVWEMTWRNSKFAGGDKKNRMFNGKIFLEKGQYRIYFETDGSHSFYNWNSTPPNNPEKYGIRIMNE